MTMPACVREHEAAGEYIEVRGQRVFVRREGHGPPVLLLHGVPASSFLYRKVLPLLAARGLQAIGFDFPGLGLSDKPRGAAYDWHALAAWIEDIVVALDVDRVHLVIHDIAGPIGAEWASNHPERIRSLTIMNTLLDVAVFRPPFPMWLYRVPALRQVVIHTQTVTTFWPIMLRIGVKHADRITREEVGAYLWLLAHNRGRQPFLDIMAGFDLSPAHRDYLREGLRRLRVPMQLLWGQHDFAIPKYQAEYAQQTFPLEQVWWLDGRHFPQEDQPEECARRIADFCLGENAT